MTLTGLQKLALGVAGMSAFGIGAFVLAAPDAFYAGYGIALGSDASLFSELRAFGAGLAGFGAVMLAGIVRPRVGATAIAAALCVFLAFPAGRLVSIAADGMPSGGMTAALAFELAVAALCLFAFRPRAAQARSRIAAR